MLLTFTQKNEQEETMDFSAQLTDQELNYLINFAITSLMQIGAIVVQQNTTEPQEVSLPADLPPVEKLN